MWIPQIVKIKVLNYLIRNTVKGYTLNDVFVVEAIQDENNQPIGIKIKYKGEELGQSQVDNIVKEIQLIRDMEAWKMMEAEFEFSARRKGLEDSTDMLSVIFAKVILYIKKTIDDKWNLITKLKDNYEES